MGSEMCIRDRGCCVPVAFYEHDRVVSPGQCCRGHSLSLLTESSSIIDPRPHSSNPKMDARKRAIASNDEAARLVPWHLWIMVERKYMYIAIVD